MALSHPAGVVGTHLSTAEMTPYAGLGAAPLSLVEPAYKNVRKAYLGED